MNIIIAGTSFPCGVQDLGNVALRHGLTPTFIDHPHNAAATDTALTTLRLETRLPDDVALPAGLFLPLLESWVSEGRRLPDHAMLRFDKRAATISRSKQALSATLAEAGLSHVCRFRVGTVEEALRVASECGYPAVLRLDTGYSGRGIWVADSANDLRDFWERQSRERTSVDCEEMRSVLDVDTDEPIVEPWLAGVEWSIDCVVRPAGVFLIRVCEKVTSVVAGRPVTLGYRITDTPDLLRELRQAVEGWCRVIFQAGLVSFACFDIRRHPNGDLVPLDFGVRLGGDSIPLLVRHAGQSRNPYSAALDAALTNDPRRICPMRAGPALVHAFAQKSGTFSGLAVLGQGEVIHSRPVGFVISNTEGIPVHRRVGTVLSHFPSCEEFYSACHSSSDWIQVTLS
jgi:hypothetical protein